MKLSTVFSVSPAHPFAMTLFDAKLLNRLAPVVNVVRAEREARSKRATDGFGGTFGKMA